MDTNDLETHLDGQAETQTLDFKAACVWDVVQFARDILAFSNVQDGGDIIIGVAEGPPFSRQGVTAEQRNTFKIDVMRDQMASYADPHVNFSVDYPTDKNDTQYICIHIEPFDEVPVICRKDSTDTFGGTIYYRNRNRRMESARISNAYDMRDILETATIRMMQRRVKAGFVADSTSMETAVAAPPTPEARKIYDDELGGL